MRYSDEAVSGTKLRRAGLDALLRDAANGAFHALYFYSLSRLARESVITMPLLKQLVHVWHVRIISVTEGIDSAQDNWEVIASIMSLMHERYIKELSANVFRGQERILRAGFCVGDYRFGYRSEPVPGSEQGRGRDAKPLKVYVIDEETAPWVVRIFHWFVHERRPLRWIARELNRRPMTGRVSQEPRPEEESEKWTRQLPHLRIIDDETYKKAQEILDENYQRHVANRSEDGKIRRNNVGGSEPRHLLASLIKCGECESNFHIGGPLGKYLFCPGYRKGICKCQTQLLRERGERMIL